MDWTVLLYLAATWSKQSPWEIFKKSPQEVPNFHPTSIGQISVTCLNLIAVETEKCNLPVSSGTELASATCFPLFAMLTQLLALCIEQNKSDENWIFWIKTLLENIL